MRISQQPRPELVAFAALLVLAPAKLTAIGVLQTAQVVLEAQAPPPVRFGAEEIRRALEKRGLKALITSQPSAAGVRIVLGQTGGSTSRGGEQNRLNVPEKPESYVIAVSSSEQIQVEGSDATGVMYGAFDLAEQITWSTSGDLAGQVQAATKSPFLEIRSVNMFLTVQDIDLPGGAFWSDEYWQGYLDMMARNRYNFLDIHGPCDAVSLTFPNGFSYFVSLPDFPEVGVGREKAAKNLARFRRVIGMASDRGIKVGYMNYEAAPPIGVWKTRRYGIDERWVDSPQNFLEGPRLEEYTRQAVTAFLKQLPELWMFGFRVGESGQPEDFYRKTYLAALNDIPSSLNIYVRTWIADPHKVRELANSTKHHLYIEPKYNGEQLGLPYQAALGGRQYPPSGSYEDYTNYPRDYSILWQIRAHGTHRVFYWGSPEFARRTVRSCKFGDGVGFSMEPMEAYCPAAEYLHHSPATDHSFYKWMFERQWLWHLTWGRTAYDPDVSEQVWLSEFERRFGAQAGPSMYKALVAGSRIVPFIYSYHNIGLDHQDFAPEFENGDHAFGARQRVWQGQRLVPYGGNNDDFLRVTPLDRTAMADPASYARNLLEGQPSGKMTPAEAAAYLSAAADASEQAIQQAAGLSPSSPKEFDCIRRDVEALDWLARYYRDRILSATDLALYHMTYDHSRLASSYDSLQRAVADWDRLSDVTEKHYGYVPETIRMGVSRFRWRDEGRGLGVDLDQIDNLETEFRQLRLRYGYRTIIGHVPPFKAKPGQPLQVTATYATGVDNAHVVLFYRNSPQAGYTPVTLALVNQRARTWTGEIPAEAVVPGYLEYYFQADQGVGGHYGGTLDEREPYRIFVNNNSAKPVISHELPKLPIARKAVTLGVRVSAKAHVSSVRVYYKQTPAYDEWVRMEMGNQGDDRYEASVPLTSEGILYYFEAIDEDGNAANYPDFLKQTPYFVINAWDPAGTQSP